MRLRNDPKCTQTLSNAPKHEFRVQWSGLGAFGAKIPPWLRGTNFCINYSSSPCFAPSFLSYETMTNAPKHYTMHQNMSWWSNGVDWIRSLWKIPTWLRGTSFCINCTSSPHFAPSFMQLRNDLKCTQTLWSALKHEFSGPMGWIECIRCEKSTTHDP